MALERAAETGAQPTALTAWGLAGHAQRWLGVRPEVAMQTALEAVRDQGVSRVRYWTSKWIVGAMSVRQPLAAKATREPAAGQMPFAEAE